MSSKTPYSNPYNLSDEMENEIQNVEVQDLGLARGATIEVDIQRSNPWSNPYNLERSVDRELRDTVAADPGVHRGQAYSAQGDDELSGGDPFKAFGQKASTVIWRQVMAQPPYARRDFMRQILVKLSPELWTTVDQAATRERAMGKSAQTALRIGLEKSLSQQMVQDLMSSGWKQAAVGLAGLGACCDACAGHSGMGGPDDASRSACESVGGKWINLHGVKCLAPGDRAGGFSGAISGGISAIGSGAVAVASAAKQVASLACDAINSPLARPAANYGGYAQGGTAGSAGAVKGLEQAQKVCGQGAKVAAAFSSPAQPTQSVATIARAATTPVTRTFVAAAPKTSKLPIVPILAVGGLLAFLALRKK